MKTKWVFGDLRKWAHLSSFCCLSGVTQCEAVVNLSKEKDGVTEDVVDG